MVYHPRNSLLCTAAVFVLATAAFPIAADERALAELKGVWKLVEMEIDGANVPPPEQVAAWHIEGSKVIYGGDDLAKLTVDAGSAPKSIDLHFAASKRDYEGVYELDRETLKLCVNIQTDGVKERPTSLATKDRPNLRLLVFKRVSPEEAPVPSGYVGIALAFHEDPAEVTITDVLDDSPAKKHGLQKDDVLLKVGGVGVTTLRSAVDACRGTKPGETVAIVVRRGGEEKSISVKSAAFPFALLGILG